MKIAFDIEEMKPGCVIVAAGLGADTKVCQRFDAKHWIVHLTPGMKVYEINEQQLEILVKKVEAAHG